MASPSSRVLLVAGVRPEDRARLDDLAADLNGVTVRHVDDLTEITIESLTFSGALALRASLPEPGRPLRDEDLDALARARAKRTRRAARNLGVTRG